MEIRNEEIYNSLARYIKGACYSSLDWRPGSLQFEGLLDFLSSQECVVRMVRWWEPEVGHKEEISRWALAFSYSYQDRLGHLVWEENVFNEIYDRFEKFLYSKDLMVTSVSPIYLFESGLKEPIELDTDVGIIPKEYDINIRYLLSHFETEHKHFSEDYEWCIYTHRMVSKAQPRESSLGDFKDATKLEDVLTSLRLLHGGLVHAGPLHSSEGSPFPGIHGGRRLLSHSVLRSLPADYIVFQLYRLKDTEVETLQQIYQQLTSLNRRNREFLDLPVGRFNDSYKRQNEKDRLIDLCVVLESLYVREREELAYRLALRCACFLERGKLEMENTFLKVKDIYDTRSQIVHGTAKQLTEQRLRELATEAEEYVRRSLCKLLSSQQYVDRISKKPGKNEVHFLDKSIFDKHPGGLIAD